MTCVQNSVFKTNFHLLWLYLTSHCILTHSPRPPLAALPLPFEYGVPHFAPLWGKYFLLQNQFTFYVIALLKLPVANSMFNHVNLSKIFSPWCIFSKWMLPEHQTKLSRHSAHFFRLHHKLKVGICQKNATFHIIPQNKKITLKSKKITLKRWVTVLCDQDCHKLSS